MPFALNARLNMNLYGTLRMYRSKSSPQRQQCQGIEYEWPSRCIQLVASVSGFAIRLPLAILLFPLHDLQTVQASLSNDLVSLDSFELC